MSTAGVDAARQLDAIFQSFCNQKEIKYTLRSAAATRGGFDGGSLFGARCDTNPRHVIASQTGPVPETGTAFRYRLNEKYEVDIRPIAKEKKVEVSIGLPGDERDADEGLRLIESFRRWLKQKKVDVGKVETSKKITDKGIRCAVFAVSFAALTLFATGAESQEMVPGHMMPAPQVKPLVGVGHDLGRGSRGWTIETPFSGSISFGEPKKEISDAERARLAGAEFPAAPAFNITLAKIGDLVERLEPTATVEKHRTDRVEAARRVREWLKTIPDTRLASNLDGAQTGFFDSSWSISIDINSYVRKVQGLERILAKTLAGDDNTGTVTSVLSELSNLQRAISEKSMDIQNEKARDALRAALLRDADNLRTVGHSFTLRFFNGTSALARALKGGPGSNDALLQSLVELDQLGYDIRAKSDR
ncbi:MAG: hypothetical protein HY897_21145 [Deltaproteobacteria bacterium]|nr:hypothetical protein [Deltaproteobacteria bacterium]